MAVPFWDRSEDSNPVIPLETRGMEARGMEARGMEARGIEVRARSAQKRKRHQVHTFLSDAEKIMLIRYARDQGLSHSSAIRQLIRQAYYEAVSRQQRQQQQQQEEDRGSGQAS